MRFLLIFILFLTYANAQTILVINSNSNIKKYQQTQEAFEKNFDGKFKSIDISKMKKQEIKKYLYDEYPDIVYAIGSRAYQYAYKYIPERKIFFSSIINWERLPKKEHFSGVLVEMHSEMHLTIIHSVFSKFKKYSILYSDYTQDVVSSFKKAANHIGVEVVTQKVKSTDDINYSKLLNSSDALIVIPDPIILKNRSAVESIFRVMKENKKPIITYDKLFLKYGALFSLSIDNPTIGRQISTMVQTYLDNKSSTSNIQYPTGTHTIFNIELAKELGIVIDKQNIQIIDEMYR